MNIGPEDIKKRLKCWWDNQEERCGESHVYCRDCPLHVPGYSMEDAVKNAIGYIYSLEAAQPKWISVEERLPEPFHSVLVHMPQETPCPTVHEGYRTNDGHWYSAHFVREFDEVTHWMPLPEPPKED